MQPYHNYNFRSVFFSDWLTGIEGALSNKLPYSPIYTNIVNVNQLIMTENVVNTAVTCVLMI